MQVRRTPHRNLLNFVLLTVALRSSSSLFIILRMMYLILPTFSKEPNRVDQPDKRQEGQSNLVKNILIIANYLLENLNTGFSLKTRWYAFHWRSFFINFFFQVQLFPVCPYVRWSIITLLSVYCSTTTTFHTFCGPYNSIEYCLFYYL